MRKAGVPRHDPPVPEQVPFDFEISLAAVRQPRLLFRSLPPLSVPFGNRISPVPRPACTHPILPAVYTNRDDAGGRGYGRAAAACRAGAAIVDRSVIDGRGLNRHPFLGRIAIGGDLAGSLVRRFHGQFARFTSHTRSSSTLRSRTSTNAPHSLQRSSIVRPSISTGRMHPQHSP